mmetsp:Transcript_88328/g.285934  ORF Transcript_88328/g.285934 Transcript_88328/m.285934 type:complete len:414 (-) Transcript_88328:118-1359(-)
MGNSSSGSCFVQLQQISFSPGDVITGTLHVCINTPVQVSEVQIKVTACEKTHWQEKRMRSETQTVNGEQRTVQREEIVNHWGSHEFFKVRTPLYRPGGMMAVGQYSFPFQVQLPLGLPGSFSLRGYHFGTHFDCKCVYKIKGVCQVSGFLKSDIKHTQYIQVIERPPPIVGQVAQETTQVNVCCCFNRGQFHISMRSDKNSYCANAGEMVQVIAEMDNMTDKDVRCTKVELRRRLVLRSSGARNFMREDTVARGTFPGLAAGESVRGDNARWMPLQLDYGLEPQCLGVLIRCAYYLRVSADVPCANDPDVRVPICIYAPVPPPQAWQAPTAPAGWSPQLMPAVNVSLPVVPTPPAADEFFSEFQPSAPPLEGPASAAMPGPAAAAAPPAPVLSFNATFPQAKAEARAPFIPAS